MKVVEFQIQVRQSGIQLSEILKTIDAKAPIPQALEGGDGNGPLYQCILCEDKKQAMEAFCEKNSSIAIYGSFHPFEMEESLYRPDRYVQWQWGSHPTVTQHE